MTGQHIDSHGMNYFVGTAGFSSLNSHKEIEQSRRDDLESLANIMIYFKMGSLPWHKAAKGKNR